MGLPSSSAMVSLSILVGNDYTSPFVKHDDHSQRKEYWESIQWCEVGEEDSGDGERLPPEGKLSSFDIQGIADYISDKVEHGLKLTSDIEDLKMAIEFFYELYSFGHVCSFPSILRECDQDLSFEDDDVIGLETPNFPSLPFDLDLDLTRTSRGNDDIIDASLYPILSYKSNVEPGNDELQYIQGKHIAAFRMTLELMNSVKPEHINIGPPKHTMDWSDVKSLYVMEKCLLAAMDSSSILPHLAFDQSIFHSCLEIVSSDNNHLIENVKEDNEEAITNMTIEDEKKEEDLVLPIDEHKEEILHAIQTQRVTIIRGETGCGKSSRLPCFLLRAKPPEPTTYPAHEVKMVVTQPRRISVKALDERSTLRTRPKGQDRSEE
jgi:hypothetical protein